MSEQELAALLSLATAMSFTPGPNTALSTAALLVATAVWMVSA